MLSWYVKYQLPFSCEKQSVKRDKRKGKHGVKTEIANAFKKKNLLATNIRIIISHGEWWITILQVMVPSGISKNYSHSYEFRQIIFPLTPFTCNIVVPIDIDIVDI